MAAIGPRATSGDVGRDDGVANSVSTRTWHGRISGDLAVIGSVGDRYRRTGSASQRPREQQTTGRLLPASPLPCRWMGS